MRNHGHLWLFVFLLLFSWEGPAAEAVDTGRSPSDAGEPGTPIVMAAPAALPALQWAPEDDTECDPEGSHTEAAAAESIAPRSLGRLHARERAWLSFRRPFSYTVSYRTTAPPSRVA